MEPEPTLLVKELTRAAKGVFQLPRTAHHDILTLLNNALKGKPALLNRRGYDTILSAWNQFKQALEDGKPVSVYMSSYREFLTVLKETLGCSLRKAA